MNEVKRMMEEVIDKLQNTREYNQYQNLLKRVKEQPDLYRRIGEFRRRGLYVKMAQNIDRVQENNNMQNDFADLVRNGLANEFLVAERQYCKKVKEFQDMFLEGANIETDFLDD